MKVGYEMGIKTGIGVMVQKGALLNLLQFTVAENQTAVGTINEPAATGFTIASGQTIFNISTSGVIIFKVAPDYEVQSYYILTVTSNKGKKYKVTVNVTDVASSFALNTTTALNLTTSM
jgi:hypothetical protein